MAKKKLKIKKATSIKDKLNSAYETMEEGSRQPMPDKSCNAYK